MRTLKKTLALVLVLAMMFSLCITASADFTDADEIKYVEAVELLSAIGVIDGMPDGTFDANGTLTRAQAAKILVYLLGAEDLATAAVATFDDVAADHWAAPYIAYCAEQGILAGYGDGKFGPSDELTAYQWAKMLLVGVYGFDAEDYTGAAWQIAIAKDANEVGVFAGNLKADKTAAATREEACLYALNAMNYTATAVTYTVTADGVVYKFDNVNDAATFKALVGGTMAQIPSTDTKLNEVFGVTRSALEYDDFGRPGVLYTNTKLLGLSGLFFGYDAIATYTAATSEAAVFADLGVVGTATSATINVYDAVAETAAPSTVNKTAKTSIAAGTGNGTVYEVYNIGTAAVPSYYAVSIASTFGEVTVSTKAATKTAGGYTAYTLGGDTYKVYTSVVKPETEIDSAVVTGTVKSGDMVLYYVVDGVAYISAVETVKGLVTEKTAVGVATIGGKQYVAAAAADAGLTVTVNAKLEASFYVDSYGYLLGNVGAVTPGDVYVMVIDTNYYQSLVEGKIVPVAEAVIAKADGSVATVNVVTTKTAAGIPVAQVDLEALEGKVVTYVEGVNGVVLGSAATANVSVLNPKSNDIGDILANANTLFIYADYAYNAAGVLAVDGTVTTVTGIANVEKVDSLTAVGLDLSMPADGIADVVYIYENTVPAGVATDYIYVIDANYTESADGYTYNVIKGGEVTTLTVSEAVLSAQALYSSIVDDGANVIATEATLVSGKVANNGGLLFVAGSYYGDKVCADDVPVYVIDKYDDTCTTINFADLTSVEGYYVVVENVAGTAVSAIYVVFRTAA